MGVPGFFGWLIEKFKRKINYRDGFLIRSKLNGSIDYLYLDSNCLFHPQCFKVLHQYSGKNINMTNDELETEMIKQIMNYLSIIINHTKVNKQIYISVDGVAPMAKISQQRKRRYKNIEDNEMTDEIRNYHNIGQKNNVKWSNIVITPGTEFMEALHISILHFIHSLSSDLRDKIVYSSYHVPGEGEHKILSNMKKKKSNNDVFVVYGLDADLFFLTMASGHKNIYLLREHSEIKNGVKHPDEELVFVSVDETRKMIHGIMDDSSNNSINDFIFLCFFIGNDFIPNVPSVDVKYGGLDTLINYYKKNKLCKMNDTYLIKIENDLAKINFNFLMIILKDISEFEVKSIININKKDAAHEKNKIGAFDKKNYYELDMANMERLNFYNLGHMQNDSTTREIIGFNNSISYYNNFNFNEKSSIMTNNYGLRVNDSPEDMSRKFGDFKFAYYDHYCNSGSDQTLAVRNICKNYFEGLIWTLEYYLDKCRSWTWHYKYNTAPFCSDLHKFMKSKLFLKTMDKIYDELSGDNNFGKVKPFTQLLMVVPPKHKNLIPEPYLEIMTKPEYGLIHNFPEKTKLDYLNRSAFYKSTPFLPMIDLDEIDDAMKNKKFIELYDKLDKNVTKRNKICKDRNFKKRLE